jgi:2-oxoglutarate dehydrogenase E1 component
MDPRALDALLLGNPEYADELYRRFRDDPDSVDPAWAALFRALDGAPAGGPPPYLTASGALPEGVDPRAVAPGIQIYDVIHTYREYGHMVADIDPLGQAQRHHPFLDLSEFGFDERDLDIRVAAEGFHGPDSATVREYLDILRETYCGPIGVEYMDLMEKEQRDWLQARMEPIRNRPRYSDRKKRQLLEQLVWADGFEEQLQAMYPGTKRFSLEGGTTLITLLRETIEEASEHEVDQVVIGMAHRGRLNVLANVLGKPLEYILAEFEGRPLAADMQGYGDVKYHLGYSNDFTAENGRLIHLSMAFNPSHLEIVDPVVEGIVRAKQDQQADRGRARVAPILIHGDAAFTGQGVVAETFTLSGLPGYETGGTVHIIVNNQVGFTADPEETRATRYASDIAKTVRAPVFHVNADHPEAVTLVARLALGFRQTFHRDVVIDLVCFRRHGHNEIDDPTYTQPMMSALIRKHPSASKIYAGKLAMADAVSEREYQEMVRKVQSTMRSAREVARTMAEQKTQRLGGRWTGIKPAGGDWSAATAVSAERLQRIAAALTRAPEGFHWHQRLQRQMAERAASITEDRGIDWGAGEALAIGSLLLDGTAVRFTGQDVGRGTFSHRHAIYTDQRTGDRYVPLAHIDPEQAGLEIINSPLSEAAALGFEYGYSSADPWSLVIWEAQFGDFVNGAQVVIDQLIASAEYKWGRHSGLVMLLPHGYEGQGPEHSSARLERFLELCAEDNLQVCNFTSPAQYFHALRRQIRREFRKPLVVMSPKSLLRHAAAVSAIADFTDGRFQPAIDDSVADRAAVTRALMCSGKIYYALDAARTERDQRDVAIIRLEQLYPYPLAEVRDMLASYPNLRQLVWVQEEPRNMGAWRNLLHRFQQSLPDGVSLDYAGRDSRAAPATGSLEVHRKEEAELVDLALRSDVVGRRLVRRHAAQ